jgi:hypothetical protein
MQYLHAHNKERIQRKGEASPAAAVLHIIKSVIRSRTPIRTTCCHCSDRRACGICKLVTPLLLPQPMAHPLSSTRPESPTGSDYSFSSSSSACESVHVPFPSVPPLISFHPCRLLSFLLGRAQPLCESAVDAWTLQGPRPAPVEAQVQGAAAMADIAGRESTGAQTP